MFHSALGVFQATEGIFCATDASVPDELRVVVASALAPTASLSVRVLTAGAANDVHDYHNQTLLASKVTASVTDAQGTVAATLVSVAPVTVASGTYATYALALARAVIPTEIAAVSVLSPYVTPSLATTAPLALEVPSPRVELSVTRPLLTYVPWAPSAALGVTAPAMPAGHKLVVGSSVTLRFAFDAPEPFGAGAAASFAATVNGNRAVARVGDFGRRRACACVHGELGIEAHVRVRGVRDGLRVRGRSSASVRVPDDRKHGALGARRDARRRARREFELRLGVP
jgi:hypothetical protein